MEETFGFGKAIENLWHGQIASDESVNSNLPGALEQ